MLPAAPQHLRQRHRRDTNRWFTDLLNYVHIEKEWGWSVNLELIEVHTNSLEAVKAV